MSLWTPGGEHEVPREPARGPGIGTPVPPSPSEATGGPASAAQPGDAASIEDLPEFQQLSPEEQERARQMAAEMAEAQRRVLETPAEAIVANHVMGLYELAVIHLQTATPDVASARLATDAMGAVLDALGNRLGEATETLTQARSQLQMAIVAVEGASAD